MSKYWLLPNFVFSVSQHINAHKNTLFHAQTLGRRRLHIIEVCDLGSEQTQLELEFNYVRK